jgi:hypothetical protein
VQAFKHFLDPLSKEIIISSCLLWTGALVLFLSYHYWGAALVADIYYEQSFWLVNEIFGGRGSHSLEFYYAKSDRFVYATIKIILLVSLVPYSFAYAVRSRRTIPRACFSADISLRAAVAAVCLVFFVSIIPLSFVTYPPLLDYPFHIARAYILNAWSDLPILQDWYDVQSFILPNMGMDLSLLLIGKFLPIESAGQVFISLTFGLTLSGCMFLYTSLYKHLSLWPLVSSFFLFNGILLLGFVNYLFGVGVLLWAVGLWIRVGRLGLWLRLVCGTLASTTLFFSHLVTLGLYAIVVAGYELQRSMGTSRSSKKAAAADLVVGASIFLLPLLLFLLSSTAGEAKSGLSYAQPFIWAKASALQTLLSGNQLVNESQFVLITLFLLAGILHGRLQIARPMYLALTMLIVTYLLMPSQALSGGLIDYRIPIAIVFITIGCTKLELRNQGWHRAALIGMAGFLLLRSIVLSYSWDQDDQVIKEYRDAFSNMASSSLLFVATGETSFNDTMRSLGKKTPVNHLGSLATIEQGVFVPAIYAHPSQQPITVNNKYAVIKEFQNNGPIRVKTAEELETVIEAIRRLTDNVLLQDKAVYILLHYPKHPPPDHTKVIVSGSRFLLLEVDRTP